MKGGGKFQQGGFKQRAEMNRTAEGPLPAYPAERRNLSLTVSFG